MVKIKDKIPRARGIYVCMYAWKREMMYENDEYYTVGTDIKNQRCYRVKWFHSGRRIESLIPGMP